MLNIGEIPERLGRAFSRSFYFDFSESWKTRFQTSRTLGNLLDRPLTAFSSLHCDFSESGKSRSKASRTWDNLWYRPLTACKSSQEEFFLAVPPWGEPGFRLPGQIFFAPLR